MENLRQLQVKKLGLKKSKGQEGNRWKKQANTMKRLTSKHTLARFQEKLLTNSKGIIGKIEKAMIGNTYQTYSEIIINI